MNTTRLLFLLLLSSFLSLLVAASNITSTPHHGNTGIISPSYSDKAATARWLVHNTNWGTMSTISSRGQTNGKPFSNIASFSDGSPGQSTGKLYFLRSALDASMIDIQHNDAVSFAVSEVQTGYCQGQNFDAEDPRCARLSLSGRLKVVTSQDEIEIAKNAIFAKHPGMKGWYSDDKKGDDAMGDHDFKFWTLELEEIWLVDFFGGPALISLEAWNRGTDKEGVTAILPESISSDAGSSVQVGSEPSSYQVNIFGGNYWLVMAVAFIGIFTFGFVLGRSSGRHSFSTGSFEKLNKTNDLELEEIYEPSRITLT
mmetsp:Transcript_9795/g.18419  ORF Transcript_9795/g.18419 Transcript_9795/m.18419 type:complete len:313 (+) Transcript_9795:356-1294(+)|eukprot:CAMPEP_0176484878 /NCGR_PEP_ID=MMETSP0200_2-20121128/4725_1 /TAXON_ID=947934 /ORGANISM="Chaetoceros sp., Strain GSL56" /LENGTH=312 /DNA_ID=CAMNT_0017881453 /DNA_START=338 /DNA_END=1276 /DNA_ORIENTATION=-